MNRPINILFIDDDDNLFIVYQNLLTNHLEDPFMFDHINTAEKIEDAISNKKYDIVILDQKLNNGNRGIDFLPLIKKINVYSHVIVNSAYGNEDLATMAIRNGADDYIKGNKEDNNEFLNVINKAIESTKRMQNIEDAFSKFSNFKTNLENEVMLKIKNINQNINYYSE